MDIAEKAAEKFVGQSESITNVKKYGRGIINDTYLVELDGREECFILQRINTHVFKQPELIMYNLRLVCEHILAAKKNKGNRISSDWKMVHIIPTNDNRDFFIDPQGDFWRALSFIHGAHSLEKISSLDDAREAGRALGIFHNLSRTLDPASLYDTLPGFHNIEEYLNHYDQTSSQETPRKFDDSERWCRQFVEERRSWAPVLEKARKQNKLQERVIHGDPKSNNVMIDDHSGRAASIIDLDTMKPGLLLYDIGDCLRSCCNISGEDSVDSDGARFDLRRCESLLSGYMGEARGCFTDQDIDFFFDAVGLIPFELGLRFYTDHLEGNHYFKTGYPSQNLDRAMVQFRLVESIEKQEDEIREIIEANSPSRTVENR